MATAAARRLTEAHRLAQLRLGAQTIARMRAIWRVLNPSALDSSFEPWLEVALPLVEQQRHASSQIAANYLRTFKQIETGVPAIPVLGAAAKRPAVATSLLVTGPLSIKRAMKRGVPLALAVVTAESASSAAAMRLALDGGRGTVLATLADDHEARGWQRVTSGRACDFCSLLAGRGAVYSATTVDFKSHDSCACSAAPVY